MANLPNPHGSGPHLEIPEQLEPAYSNLVRVSHSASDLVMDFARILPGSQAAVVMARIMMSPIGAKLFCRALVENLARYETTYGEIAVPGDQSLATDLFRQIRPPDGPPTPGQDPAPEGTPHD